MTDLGLLSYYLGIEVSQAQWSIFLRQSGYASRILQEFNMDHCNAAKFPVEPKLKLSKNEEDDGIDITVYRSMVGCLRYLTHTRPDLSYAVGFASRFMKKPTLVHLQVVKRILRYVKGTSNYGLCYQKGQGMQGLVGFSDSDFGGDAMDCKSMSGMIFYLGRNPICWQSQKQKTVALSSCEAEFIAATGAACQAIWLTNLLKELTGKDVTPVTLFVDNKSAIALMKNPVFHSRSKHIDIWFHFIRESVEKGHITVEHVNTKDQCADIFTKALPLVKFIEMRNLIGVTEVDSAYGGECGSNPNQNGST